MSGPFKMKGFPAHAGVSPMKQSPDTHNELMREIQTYGGDALKPSAETKDYYEGQTKKTSTKGKIKAFVKSATGGGSYKEEKKKQRQKTYRKGKKEPSELETYKYIKTLPSTDTTPVR